MDPMLIRHYKQEAKLLQRDRATLYVSSNIENCCTFSGCRLQVSCVSEDSLRIACLINCNLWCFANSHLINNDLKHFFVADSASAGHGKRTFHKCAQ